MHQSWPTGGDLNLVGKLVNCADELERWGRQIRIQFRKEINECMNELEALRGNTVQ